MRQLWVIAAAAAFTACAGGGGSAARESEISREVEQTVRASESRAAQSRTMGSLSKMEESLADFVKTENRIPEGLAELIPKYLAEIPPVDLGMKGHAETTKVKVYPASVLRDGQIDGSQLKDTGRWGYVHNERQVVVFVDCTHLSPAKKPWYQEHGNR